MKLTPQQRKAFIKQVGKTLFGERYGAPLARLVGVDQSLIARIVSDTQERVATDLFMDQLVEGLAREWQRRQAAVREIEAFIEKATGQPLADQPHLFPAVSDEPKTEIE